MSIQQSVRNYETCCCRPVEPFQWTLLQPKNIGEVPLHADGVPDSQSCPRRLCGRTAQVGGRSAAMLY